MKHAIKSRIMLAASALTAILGAGLFLALSFSALSGTPLPHRAAVPVSGQDLSALIQTCRLEKTSCHAYPLAVATGSLTTSRLLKAPDLFCLPAAIRDADLPAAVSRFIDAKPEARQWPAPLVVIAALTTAFPCQSVTPVPLGAAEKDNVK